jgi:hypothetical protein
MILWNEDEVGIDPSVLGGKDDKRKREEWSDVSSLALIANTVMSKHMWWDWS